MAFLSFIQSFSFSRRALLPRYSAASTRDILHAPSRRDVGNTLDAAGEERAVQVPRRVACDIGSRAR